MRKRGGGTLNLHSAIGDYKREIDKIKAKYQVDEKVPSVTVLKRISVIKNKIRDLALTLQKRDW